MKKIQSLLVPAGGVFLRCWVFISAFRYFTYNTKPLIDISGITQGGYYAQSASCTVHGNSGYKIKKIITYVDNKRLTFQNEYVGSTEFERNLDIDLSALPNGKHSLMVYVEDASYNQNKTKQSFDFFVDNEPLQVAFVEDDFTADQGKTIHVKIRSNKKLAKAEVGFRAQVYPCYKESPHSLHYECFIPVECHDQPNDYSLTALIVDKMNTTKMLKTTVQVNAYAFKKARGDYSHLGEKLAKEREVSKKERDLNQHLEKLRLQASREKLWDGPFLIPIDMERVTTPFGEVRTTPEKGRYHHAAVDFVGKPHAVIWASQRGRVLVKERFLFSGNTVVLDHGRGITTLYCHLNSFADLEVGDEIEKGNPVGYQGKTGYALGEHLHWEVRVHNRKVDPLEWTKKIF